MRPVQALYRTVWPKTVCFTHDQRRVGNRDARLKRVEAEDAHDLIDLSACINKMASCIPCVPLCYNCIGLRPQAHSRKCLPQNAARQPDLP